LGAIAAGSGKAGDETVCNRVARDVVYPLGRPMLDDDVLPFDIAQLAQPLAECLVEERRDVAE